jgi:hypothetical protein
MSRLFLLFHLWRLSSERAPQVPLSAGFASGAFCWAPGGRSGKERFPLSPPFDQEAVKKRWKSVFLGSFPESLIDEDLHIHATVQGAPLCVGVLGGGMSGTVARGGNDSPHGNISFFWRR